MEKILSTLVITRLRDMIKQIRSAKTMADERAVIAKESAFIRTSFKSENVETRYINVQKLLYIYMLGYPAHFGQMECLKLVASPKFMDKRLGYLGIMLLLDENQELLTLVTNSLKNDMNNGNIQIVGLALCTLGNISSPEMARDLSGEVEKLISSGNSFVRKKAALCAIRLIHKVPDLLENYQSKAIGLLQDKHHGVLLTGVTLLTEMCKIDANVAEELRKTSVPVLVRHLKNLTTPGFSPEHDVSGITDPFLQVKILRLLRLLGTGSTFASDAMNDILAQVATNTDGTKNVGNAILYETVLTIMDIESENSLRVLAINILGRFLSNKDNNIRYVALTTLTKTSQTTLNADSSALQRHRATILDCLKDADVSIRHRALDLSFFLINSQNIRILTRELLSFLEVAESDIKSSVASRIVDFAGRFRPNKRWELDTTIRVMRAAGANVDASTINHCVKLVTTSPKDLQLYAVRKFFNLIRLEGDQALAQEGLVVVTVWCIGEFGDALVRGGDSGTGGDEEDSVGQTDYMIAPTERQVIDILESILRGPFASIVVKEYIVTALAKLTGRFLEAPVLDSIRAMLAKYQTHMDVEIQARAVEFTAITKLDSETRAALLESMPVLESALKEEERKGTGQPALMSAITSPSRANQNGKVNTGNILDFSDDVPVNVPSTVTSNPAAGNDLLDLVFGGAPTTAPTSSGFGAGFGSAAPVKSDNIMDLLGGLSMGSAPAPSIAPMGGLSSLQAPLFASQPQQPSKPAGNATVDLLGDLFGSGPSASPAPTSFFPTSTAAAPPAFGMGINTASNDLFGSLLSSNPTPTSSPMSIIPPSQPKSYPCYEKNGLRISLTPERVDGGLAVSVNAKFENTGMSGPITGVVFQVAVPKTLKLTMQPPSSTTVLAGGFATQAMRIDNPSKTSIKLRIKLGYSAPGFMGSAPQLVEEIVDFGGFEASLWA
ncbi:Adaptor protein complex AP-1 gamma subunit [Rhizoclosmatium globosum]|uniref:AP-1 complex subunit gamma n=1 Tax=Rhizoclosmatium globosum TaxID=329046 RepID=A0A1Y2C702_9FUNG|nr:Adaptor protein complex AP-1 gamma subunit [Rhizoclosmatium globosum]|eukprot:ORY42809.1 Adaptor protein complex AP-1 gamma subunit [Rhizoclosmatium globosum]